MGKEGGKMNISKITHLTELINRLHSIEFRKGQGNCRDMIERQSIFLNFKEEMLDSIIKELNNSISPVIEKYIDMFEKELKEVISKGEEK